MKVLHATVVFGLAVSVQGAPAQTTEPAWRVIGAQGIVRAVIVPHTQASDRAAYMREIERLCPARTTCFLNFHTNSTGAPESVPLPDAISAEATARYRRSMKNGMELFEFHCRLGVEGETCFGN